MNQSVYSILFFTASRPSLKRKKVLACYGARAVCSNSMLQEPAVSAGEFYGPNPVPLAESHPFKPLSPRWCLVLILAASMSLWAALFWAFPSSG